MLLSLRLRLLELPLITADKKIQKVTGLEVIEYHLSAGV